MSRVLAPLALLLAGCASAPHAEVIATARVAGDLEGYALQRVGLMPVDGARYEASAAAPEAEELQSDLYAELAIATPYEIVRLTPADVAEARPSEPVRRGAYRAETLLFLAERHRLDAVLFASVTERRLYPPLSISLSIDLVAVDTGQVLWSSSVHLDARDPRVQQGLRAYYSREHRSKEGQEGWDVALLSPRRFARFAAWQVAQLL